VRSGPHFLSGKGKNGLLLGFGKPGAEQKPTQELFQGAHVRLVIPLGNQ
jgi:hypothetical protein